MTRHLARLADLSYRRRGRMLLAWVVATVVIIGVGGALAGEFNADYNTPGSESKAAGELTEKRFGGYSGQEIYVAWKDPAGAKSPAAQKRIDAFLAEAKKVDHIGDADRDPHLAGRQDRVDHAPVDGRRLGRPQGGRREADRRRREEQRRRAPDQAPRRSDLRGAGDDQPRGPRVPRRRDRAPDRVRLRGRRGAAARHRPLRSRNLLRRPDRPARQRHRRARLDDGGVGPDRHRRRRRLRLARAHPLPGGDGRRQGPARRGDRGRDHRGAQRDPRRRHRRDLRARPGADRAAVHVRRRHLGLARRARRDARRGHAAARAALLPRAERRPAAAAADRPPEAEGGWPASRSRARWSHAVQRRPWTAAIAGDRDPARAGRARARHAPRLPRRRQRPAEHDDPPGLRPQHGGLRARLQRPAGDRRGAARCVRRAEGRRLRAAAPG